MPLSGCGGSGASSTQDSSVPPAEVCSYRASDKLAACIVLRPVVYAASAPTAQAGELQVGGVVAISPLLVGLTYYDSDSPEWEPSGEWIIYNRVFRPKGAERVVSGYNPATGAKWIAMFNTSGGREIKNGRVYYNHTESAGTTRHSVAVDGTDNRREP